jgi:uncharacterized protein
MMTIAEDVERKIEHRPWPPPRFPWLMFQTWRRLLFAHWRVPFDALRPLVPRQLELEEYDGSAWVGLTPFLLTDLRPRYLPALPRVSDFPEMNLRTYVRRGDRPGIFFFSLDAGSRLAVAAARAMYRLPYFHASMTIDQEGDWIRYASRRETPGAAEFVARYRPTGASFQPALGSLEHFLIERYALYAVLRNGHVLRGDIHHEPWRVRAAEAVIERNTVPAEHGIPLPDEPPLLHYSARQDALIWPPVTDEGGVERMM